MLSQWLVHIHLMKGTNYWKNLYLGAEFDHFKDGLDVVVDGDQ